MIMDTHFNFASAGEYNIAHKIVKANIFLPPIAQTIEQLAAENTNFDAEQCLSHVVATVSPKSPTMREVFNVEAERIVGFKILCF